MSPSQEERTVLITGIGHVVHPAYEEAMAGKRSSPPEETPEITGFEVPEDEPTWGFEVLDFEIENHLPNIKTFVDRTSAFALVAAQAALRNAGLLEPDKRPAGVEIGCAYGTTLGCLEAMKIFWQKLKKGNPKFAPPLPFTHSYTNSPSSLLCIEFSLKGSAATFSGESLAGVEAMLFAVDQIRTGAAQIVVVAASESLSSAMHAHLRAEGRLSSSGNLRPWASGNDGVVPGEGGVCVVLESAESARARGHSGLARVTGVGLGAGSGEAGLSEAWQRAADQALASSTETPSVIIPAASGDDTRDTTESACLTNRLGQDMSAAVVSPKCCSGELLSASALLGGALGSRLLAGQKKKSEIPCAFVQSNESTNASDGFSRVLVGEVEPEHCAGIIALAAV